jgi:hypothetical protein
VRQINDRALISTTPRRALSLQLAPSGPRANEAWFLTVAFGSAPFFAVTWPCGTAEVVAVAFQIVALTLDANDNVIERRVVPYPYPTRQEAVTAIECIVSTFA